MDRSPTIKRGVPELNDYGVSSWEVVETYEFSSDSWRVLDDVTLDEVPHGCVSIKGNIYWANTYTTDDFLLFLDVTKERVKRMCLPQFQYSGCNVLSVVGEEKLALLHLSNFTSKMDMWVTDKIDIDTEAALRWRKSFTVDEPDYVPLPMSFLLDEEKEVALRCACSEVSEFMIQYETTGPEIWSCGKNPLTWQGFLLGIREEGLSVSSSHFKRKDIYHALRYANNVLVQSTECHPNH
ncbi:unnamed protein product [Brassica rapa]|uniref:F-box associated beta-propeller type 1 domain-containing protein n=1 Tax=Brassica campestris TaxID=3711 RepID=A0A8D9M8M1_BRACM|nr:unnamed protein product [Brassica rapa]